METIWKICLKMGGCIPNFIAIMEKSSTGFWDTLQSHMGHGGPNGIWFHRFTTNSSKKSSWNERPAKTVRKTILRLYGYTYKLPAINKITFTRLILYTLRKKWILG